ncbi:hypothetical protein F5Y04DRAFT_146967 [Hypomontagnella monticulosa]|nr:hypothetical protein F5Y04DRAFT_146967 [Hypomontagnella monticulosa]
MPSVKNPNGPSKNRLAARAAKARKQGQKRDTNNGKNRITKADEKRGARTGLLPTSGPNAALSAKKRRKLERRMGHAMQRKREQEEEEERERVMGKGEVEMKDADASANKTTKLATTTTEAMAIDDTIS